MPVWTEYKTDIPTDCTDTTDIVSESLNKRIYALVVAAITKTDSAICIHNFMLNRGLGILLSPQQDKVWVSIRSISFSLDSLVYGMKMQMELTWTSYRRPYNDITRAKTDYNANNSYRKKPYVCQNCKSWSKIKSMAMDVWNSRSFIEVWSYFCLNHL